MMGTSGHIRLEHENCRLENCSYCIGGLFTCTTCGASEGELPAECPGAPMSEKQRNAVYSEQIDFVGGQWISKRTYQNGKPMFAADGTMLNEAGNRSIFDDVDE